ncbi:MAG: 4Fe-4S dicluster domain-containing protein [Myxococcota bacterium]|nr:4Fe-4S dicluster domain-containing protein [Myxococcota bacterium]MDW8362839.1 4Fe-4S dicluster domain-containing protein [Myxococcales bacterium]
MSKRAPYEPVPRRYARPAWTSVEDLRDPERSRERATVEPGMLLDQPVRIGRRGFMSLSAAAAAVTSLGGCLRRPVEHIVPFSQAPEHVLPGIPLHFATVLERRGEPIGVLVTSHEGRPTKIEGNAEHPGSRGALDAIGQAQILDLYDPDRSKSAARVEGGSFRAAPLAELDKAVTEAAAEAERDGGAGLRVLMPSSSSPSVHRLRQAIRARLPRARLHVWDSVHEGEVYAGSRIAFGQPYRMRGDFARARVIVAADADFLGTEPGAIAASHGFASGRRLESSSGSMNRLYVVEPSYTVTGAAADHRLRLPATQIGRWLLAVARRLAEAHGVAVGPVGAALREVSIEGVDRRWIDVVAAELAQARALGLLVVGTRQPAWVHALAAAIQSALGQTGSTARWYAPADPEGVDPVGSLRELVDDMKGGRVRTLFVIGANPVYDAPADLGFGEALGRVQTVFHYGTHEDETAARAHWHGPLAHPLEAWGDARSSDGALSVQQPLIAPLWGARSAIEVLAQLAGVPRWRGYDVVRETMRRYAADDGFERFWRRTLHAGLVPGTGGDQGAIPTLEAESVARAVAAAVRALPPAPSAQALEVDLAPCSKLHDGRHANNPWLLELPEPMTKVSWDNAALLSPATARALGVRTGDVVRLERDGAAIETPVFVQPGQADHCVSLALGWGRMRAGRYGNGCGVDVHPLRTTGAMALLTGVRLTPTGRRAHISQTQEHPAMEGRPLVIDATLEQYRERPDFPAWLAVEPDAAHGQRQLWDDPLPYDGHKWGMVVDLTVCTGCQACVVACQAENNIPSVGKRQVARGREMYWMRIDRYFVGEGPEEPQVALQPVACQHCENAPCENVCPVNATTHSPEGLNDMAYNRCIGTRYCMNNCPYKVRRFNFRSWHHFLDDPHGSYDTHIPETRKMQFNPNVTVRMRGVVEKCTYCVQRIEAARIAARREERTIRDGDVVTACQQTCPTGAIVFGDLNDRGSRVALLAGMDRRYRLLVELGTRPRTTYLARIRNPHPEMPA